MTDHPLIRADGYCPICHSRKDVGTVACWACYRSHGMKYGNPETERIIAAREEFLEARAQVTP